MRIGFAALTVAYVLSQFYRAFLAVLAPVLDTDIGASAEDLAFASGIWLAAFAGLQLPIGYALDYLGPRRTAGGLVLAAAAELTDPEKAPAVAGVTATIAPPSGPEGRFTHVHSLGLGLNAAAEHKEGAQRFLQWLATPEAMAIYARAGGAPGLTGAALEAVVGERSDLAPLGEYASRYGYVMRGGTSANALAIYQLQAAEFTGYWAGTQSLDQALANTTKGMTGFLAGK